MTRLEYEEYVDAVTDSDRMAIMVAAAKREALQRDLDFERGL